MEKKVKLDNVDEKIKNNIEKMFSQSCIGCKYFKSKSHIENGYKDQPEGVIGFYAVVIPDGYICERYEPDHIMKNWQPYNDYCWEISDEYEKELRSVLNENNLKLLERHKICKEKREKKWT